MTNGPPTPPPTTAAELIDEAKGRGQNPARPVPASDHLPSSSKNDPFQLAYPTIAGLATQGKFHELVQVAEQTEIDSDNDQCQTRLLVTAPLVLAYLILDDLPPARYALTRLPENVWALPLCQALLNLLASAWERNHAMVYARAESLIHMIEQPEFEDAKVIASMATVFVDSFRRRSLVLVSKVYKSLPLSLAETYLGLPGDQLLSMCEKHGWSYDPSAQVLSPTVTASHSGLMDLEVSASSLETFHFVASSVSKMEI